jgi:hypothetical protein
LDDSATTFSTWAATAATASWAHSIARMVLSNQIDDLSSNVSLPKPSLAAKFYAGRYCGKDTICHHTKCLQTFSQTICNLPDISLLLKWFPVVKTILLF